MFVSGSLFKDHKNNLGKLINLEWGEFLNPFWTGGLRVFCQISQKRFNQSSRNFVTFKTNI